MAYDAAKSAGPVLVVEDDEDIRTMLALTLETFGYAVETAAGGERALDMVRAGPRPAVLLVDLMMPGMSGEDLVGRLRADPAAADLPIVLFSGHSTLPDMARALPVEGYLAKPVDVEQLLQVVSSFSRPAPAH